MSIVLPESRQQSPSSSLSHSGYSPDYGGVWPRLWEGVCGNGRFLGRERLSCGICPKLDEYVNAPEDGIRRGPPKNEFSHAGLFDLV